MNPRTEKRLSSETFFLQKVEMGDATGVQPRRRPNAFVPLGIWRPTWGTRNTRARKWLQLRSLSSLTGRTLEGLVECQLSGPQAFNLTKAAIDLEPAVPIKNLPTSKKFRHERAHHAPIWRVPNVCLHDLRLAVSRARNRTKQRKQQPTFLN